MKIINKKASFDHEFLEHFETGIVLTGAEAKAVRMGRADLSRSFAKFVGSELFLINANISLPSDVHIEHTRTRKLLLHKNELRSILGKMSQKKLTLVPVSLYNKGRLIKADIALSRSKREYQKKDSLKKKDIQRDIERELK